MAPFFYFSNYLPNHPLFDLKNKSKLGKWKNECAGKNIISAIAVRSKVYSLEMIDDDHYDNIMNSAEGAFDVNPNIKSNMKRCKGVKRHLIEKKIRHEDFRASVLEKKNKNVDFYTIQSKKHKISTYKQRKLALSGFYDKRYVLDW